jgi:hypothetical protein
MIEFLRDTWDDITLAASTMETADVITVLIMGILEISFIATIVMLVSAY